MTHLRLTYFGFTGRASAIRNAFVIGGLAFDDNRISFEEWGQTNGDQALYPQGSVPVLDVDDVKISDSAAILHYVGARTGLLPSDPLDLARVVEIGALIEQIYSGDGAACNFASTMRIENEEEKKLARQGRFTDTVRYYLGVVNKIVGASANGFAVGGKLTLADLSIHSVISHMLSKDVDYFDDAFIGKEFPALVQIRDNVNAIPAVAAYNASGKGWATSSA